MLTLFLPFTVLLMFLAPAACVVPELRSKVKAFQMQRVTRLNIAASRRRIPAGIAWLAAKPRSEPEDHEHAAATTFASQKNRVWIGPVQLGVPWAE